MTAPPPHPEIPVREALTRLATNLRWVWHRPTRTLLRELAADIVDGWDGAGRNPVEVVRRLDDAALDARAADPAWRSRVRQLHDDLEAYLGGVDPRRPYPGRDAGQQRCIAYFSAEFALADGLAIFSGGLGVLAGDHLRSASDLGVPLVAVGLAYRHGYFVQTIGGDGRQQAHPATNDFEALPVHAVVGTDGRTVTVEVPMGDGAVQVRAWRVDVGRVPLYLLDTDVAGNAPHHRAITGPLYGGDRELRLRQELVLGVGGVRLLDALRLDPDVFHLNEGHAALAGLERLVVRHRDRAAPLETTIAAVRDELLFTTHTPVPAGHDTFDGNLAHHHLAPLVRELGVDFGAAWALANDGCEDHWNQTVLALRLAGRTNGVARLHGAVSRTMFAHLWPGSGVDDVPIGHVTNGVHPSTWVGPEIATLLDEHAPGWDGTGEAALDGLESVDPAALWAAHERSRTQLLGAVEARLVHQAAREGTSPDGRGLDPEALTIGFARRFATYKRGTLLARDIDRLAGILTAEDRPVQVIVAGKAHPADSEAQHLITELVALSRDRRLGGRLVVVEGYDLELAAQLVAGCDVWLNTPLRPMEASGTSGMKAAMNGSLNVSVLDGWWDEAFQDLAPRAEAGIGWVIGDAQVSDDRGEQDARDADALYRVLTDDVVPLFYDRDADHVPLGWVAMMLDTMRLLSPRFSSHRMVRDYLGLYAIDPR